MTSLRNTSIKVGIFGIVMLMLTAVLFAIFSQYRAGSDNKYSAVFADASSLKAGDSVRVAGVRVGTVTAVDLQPDNSVVVGFGADREVMLTSGTKAAVRYLNLVGDRFLDLIDSPGSAKIQDPGSVIPADRTEAALDLDLLLGGLKPVVQGLNPQAVNAQAFADQKAKIERFGGVEALIKRGDFGYSPAPGQKPVFATMLEA